MFKMYEIRNTNYQKLFHQLATFSVHFDIYYFVWNPFCAGVHLVLHSQTEKLKSSDFQIRCKLSRNFEKSKLQFYSNFNSFAFCTKEQSRQKAEVWNREVVNKNV